MGGTGGDPAGGAGGDPAGMLRRSRPPLSGLWARCEWDGTRRHDGRGCRRGFSVHPRHACPACGAFLAGSMRELRAAARCSLVASPAGLATARRVGTSRRTQPRGRAHSAGAVSARAHRFFGGQAGGAALARSTAAQACVWAGRHPPRSTIAFSARSWPIPVPAPLWSHRKIQA